MKDATRAATDTTRKRGGAVAEPGYPLERLPGLDDLADAVLSLDDVDEVSRFLRDLCTVPELEAITHRWQTVLLLDEGVPYVEIAERVPTSTATVTRVAHWLRHGTGGYRIALARRRPRSKAPQAEGSA